MLGRNLLGIVPQQQVFWLANGKSVESLRQLAAELKKGEEWVFKHHVNEYKNDFYVWVKDVFQHAELAADLLACEEKEKLVECLQHWLVQAEKEQRAQYWEHVQQAQQTVTNPRLRIQKNPAPEGKQPSPERGVQSDFQGILGFDMRRIAKFKLPTEAEGAALVQESTTLKYDLVKEDGVVKKMVAAAEKGSILRQLKEVYR